MLTVFTKEGDIVCTHETPNASAEQPTYTVSGPLTTSPPVNLMYYRFSYGSEYTH